MQRSWRATQRSNTDMHKLYTSEMSRQTEGNIWSGCVECRWFVTEERSWRKEASRGALKTWQLESCTGKCERYISVAQQIHLLRCIAQCVMETEEGKEVPQQLGTNCSIILYQHRWTCSSLLHPHETVRVTPTFLSPSTPLPPLAMHCN